MKIEIKILNKKFYSDNASELCPEGYPAKLPSYATPGAAAMDLRCTVDIVVNPGETKAIHTGVGFWIGSNDYLDTNSPYKMSIAGLILPRSGLGTKGLILSNTIGVIDSDYQGEIIIQAYNKSQYKVTLKGNDRVAQLMFVPVIKPDWIIVDEFSGRTGRGEGSFGSTGQ